MPHLSALADAIVELLESLDLGANVTISRQRLVRQNLEGLSETLITVVPFGVDFDLEARGGLQRRDLDVRIVIQRKLYGAADEETADNMATLAEDLAAALIGCELLGAECQAVRLAPSYDPAKMEQLNAYDATLFTSWRAIDDGPAD